MSQWLRLHEAADRLWPDLLVDEKIRRVDAARLYGAALSDWPGSCHTASGRIADGATCFFCREPLLPGAYYCRVGELRAHYDCTPMLGAEPERWFVELLHEIEND